MRVNEIAGMGVPEIDIAQDIEEQTMSLEERARKVLRGEIVRTPEEIAKGDNEVAEIHRYLYGNK